MRILVECGRHSPGVIYIKDSPVMKQMQAFIHYLNKAVKQEDLNSVNIYYMIRTFWALPRLGCTFIVDPKQQSSIAKGDLSLIDRLLSSILVLYN